MTDTGSCGKMDGTWFTPGVNEKLEGREERREGVRGKPSLGVGTAGERTGAPSTRSQAAARTSEGASSMWRASKNTRQPGMAERHRGIDTQ